MNLRDFEYSFPSQYLIRAKDYITTDSVSLISSAPGRYIGKISGIAVEVEVTLDGYDIVSAVCGCTLHRAPRCVHAAAVFYRLKRMLDTGESLEIVRSFLPVESDMTEPFSGETLRKLSCAVSDYPDAYRIAQAGLVRSLKEKKTSFGSIISAEVISGDKNDSVAVKVNDAHFPMEYSCSCDRSLPSGKMCRHALSLMCKAYPKETEPDVKSDQAILSLLKSVNIPTLFSEIEESALSLEPFIEDAGERLTVGFRVGKERMYIIHDLQEFAGAFSLGTILRLGKAFEFAAVPESLDERGRKYLRFILRNKKYIGTDEQYQKTRQKYISLPMSEADRLFEIAEGSYISVGSDKCAVSRRNPDISIALKEGGKNGFVLYIKERGYRFIGEGEFSYLLRGGEIIISDSLFAKRAGALVKVLVRAGAEGVKIAKADVSSVYMSLILPAKHYINFETSNEEVLHSLPSPLDARLYIDSDGKRLFAKLMFIYGDSARRAFSINQSAASVDREGEAAAEYEVRRWFKNIDASSGVAFSDETFEDYMRIIGEGVLALSEKMTVELSDEVERRSVRRAFDARLSVDANGGLLDLEIDSSYSPQELSSILATYRRGVRYHVFSDGSYLDLEEETFVRFAEIGAALSLSDKELHRKKMKLPFYRILYLNSLSKENSSVSVECGQAFKRIIKDFEDSVEIEHNISPYLKKIMRGYQYEGFKWLCILEKYSFGGILADDMGLGKTLQAISLIESYWYCTPEEEREVSLVVSPSSLVYNWMSEFEKFAPYIRVKVITGPAHIRSMLLSSAQDCDVIITSYDVVKRDIDLYRERHFRYVVIDEAQYIKNRATQAAKAVKAINADMRFALTGTPVENRPSDLFSIFDFIMPGYLGSYRSFRENYEFPIMKDSSSDALERLKMLTQPFILRRMKSDVLSELPEKTESVLCTEFENEQKRVYSAYAAMLVKDLRDKITHGSAAFDRGGRMMVLSMLMKIRQICCHPPLALGSEYDGESAKLSLCMDLIRSSVESGHQILLFSQFTTMLDVISERLTEEGISYFVLTGKTPQKERMELVNRFNSGDASVFLISLKAGGTGLNLTAADIVIHYDPWWNVATQNQATDRAYRIGQDKNVQVFKLIIKNSIEEKIIELQKKKAGIAEILSGERENAITRMNAEELIGLFDNL